MFLQNRELALWRELLVDPEFDATLNAEDLGALKQRLEKAALLLVSAEKPEDVPRTRSRSYNLLIDGKPSDRYE
jgi:hypothetical protein